MWPFRGQCISLIQYDRHSCNLDLKIEEELLPMKRLGKEARGLLEHTVSGEAEWELQIKEQHRIIKYYMF